MGITDSGPRARVFAMSVNNLAGYGYNLKSYEILGGPGWATTDRYDMDAKADGEDVPDANQSKNGPKFKESAPEARQLLTMSGAQVAQMVVTKGGMEQLARQFWNSNGVDRPVLDRTGLTETYDYKLSWARDVSTAASDSPEAVSIFTALQEQARAQVGGDQSSHRISGDRFGGEAIGELMEPKADILQGTLVLLVLRTLEALGPLHGYGIARRTEQISSDVLRLNQGTLYPALLRMEQEKWIMSKWGASEKNRRAKFYSITAAGKKQLAKETQDWQQTSSTIERFLVSFS